MKYGYPNILTKIPHYMFWVKKYMKQNFLSLFTLIALRSYAEPWAQLSLFHINDKKCNKPSSAQDQSYDFI